MSFEAELRAFANKTNNKFEDTVSAVCFQLSSSIIKRTPVDTGRARGNWIASLNSPAKGAGKGNASTALTKASSVSQKAAGNIFYLVNNLSYIGVIEYGGYPSPVKKGTYDKNKKTYVIKSSGGYSIQAPNGMVGLTVLEFQRRIREAIR